MYSGISLFPIDVNNPPNITKGSAAPIWIVDDDLEQLEIVSRYYLKTKRQNPLLLLNGTSELLQQWELVTKKATPVPSLILLDINMPGLDGFHALSHLKSSSMVDSLPPIVMFSVSEYEKDILKAKDLGAFGYLTKPSKFIQYQRLFSSI